MPTTRKASAPATKTKAPRSASNKPAGVLAPASVPEFDTASHYEEIAEVAYFKWLERAGSAKEDWLTAEIEVRARYMR
jgi:hypothetical protein